MGYLMKDVEQMARELERDMRAEATQRLKIIAPKEPKLSNIFAKSGTIYTYDLTPRTAINGKNPLRVANDKEMEVVHYMENEQGNLPYLIIKRATEYRLFYDILYVSYDKKNWGNERSSIQKHGRSYSEPYVFEIETDLVPQTLDESIDLMYHKFTDIKLNLD